MPGIIMVKLKRINLERRRGNFEGTSALYEEAMNETSDQELATFFAIRYSRFLSKVGITELTHNSKLEVWNKLSV